MAKSKTHYVCSNCGATYAQMIGKCFSCGSFNSVQEEVKERNTGPSVREMEGLVTPVGAVQAHGLERIKAPGKELNRVLGGGLVPGAVILLGGEPGIGKSTLLLQTALRMNDTVLYVSGEESLNQIKLRAERIGIQNEACLLLNATCVEDILTELKKIKPAFAIIDSIQTMYSRHLDSTPGTVAQIRECTALLIHLAKQHDIPMILVGHITKEGQLAGPKLLEHMVDTVLQFEGETQHAYRILRTLKNRFGSAQEIGIYEMSSSGMREVSNPSEILITARNEHLSGIAIASSMEGNRPLLIEAQALVSPAVYGTPQRNANGYDLKRLNMVLAILEKRAGLPLSGQDVFINIAGGLRVIDPAADLAVAMAIASSYKNESCSPKLCMVGEIGLSGEVRAVSRVDQRLKEAKKLGMSEAIVSAYAELDDPPKGLKIHRVEQIRQCLELLFP